MVQSRAEDLVYLLDSAKVSLKDVEIMLEMFEDFP
jgi:hypothetical protein